MAKAGIITCSNVSVRYETGFAVQDVSFDLKQGDYLCVVGENGSGKSTLMKCILGLIKPTTGEIQYGGIRQTQIGYLPQQTVIQRDFPASVREVVLSGCMNRHGLLAFYTEGDRERVAKNMALLGIETLKDKSYADLSGGQQQRVLLARALCATEKLLMLDEPVTGLDPMVAGEMYDLLQKLNREMGITVIMISHDIKSAVKYGNKILHLRTSPLFYGLTDQYLATDTGRRMLGGGEVV